MTWLLPQMAENRIRLPGDTFLPKDLYYMKDFTNAPQRTRRTRSVDLPGQPWHCHIIDHQDNHMMRPDAVNPLDVPRTYIQGVDH